jgi:hypothetical protein
VLKQVAEGALIHESGFAAATPLSCKAEPACCCPIPWATPTLRPRPLRRLAARDPAVGSTVFVCVTPDELMDRLSGLRRAQIGGRRAPHKRIMTLFHFLSRRAWCSSR